jgi:hypothetical protein
VRGDSGLDTRHVEDDARATNPGDATVTRMSDGSSQLPPDGSVAVLQVRDAAEHETMRVDPAWCHLEREPATTFGPETDRERGTDARPSVAKQSAGASESRPRARLRSFSQAFANINGNKTMRSRVDVPLMYVFIQRPSTLKLQLTAGFGICARRPTRSNARRGRVS